MSEKKAATIFPTSNDFLEISKGIDFGTTNSKIMALEQIENENDVIWSMMYGIQSRNFVIELQNRWADAARSYILLRFYYDVGIPDDEWFLSPGKNGESIEYFPHFNEQDHITKEWFDYYADMFYYKIFSALDILGHWLNSRYRLGFKQRNVNFHKVVKRLEAVSPPLAKKLRNLKAAQVFADGAQMRNDIVHNFHPSSAGSEVRISENEGSLGIRSYQTSFAIVQNTEALMKLFLQILNSIHEE